MGKAKDCMYCVAGLTQGFNYTSEISDPRVWEKALVMNLCDSGMRSKVVARVLLDLRLMMFIYKVSGALGLDGAAINNPILVTALQALFIAGWTPLDAAAKIRRDYPNEPLVTQLSSNPSISLDSLGL